MFSNYRIDVSTGRYITDDMVQDATALFNLYYGAWERDANNPSQKPRVTISTACMRKEFLSHEKSCIAMIRCDGVRVGHAIGCTWEYQGMKAMWVTQLVVHKDYRRMGIARRLLYALSDDDTMVYGMMSSHPAALAALVKACGGIEVDGELVERPLSSIPLDFIQHNAETIMTNCPIGRVRTAKVHGSLFDPEPESDAKPALNGGAVSTVAADYHNECAESQEALESFQQAGKWPLGELPLGHEHLLVFQTDRPLFVDVEVSEGEYKAVLKSTMKLLSRSKACL